MTTTADALLEAVLDAPESDEPRLVYADLLQERGDPRGEFIAVQCRLAQLPASAPDRAVLAEREAELWKENRKVWLGAARETKLAFARGFGHRWKLPPDRFAELASMIFAREPVRELDLSQGDVAERVPAGAMAAFARPELARVRVLSLRRLTLPVADLQRAYASAHLHALRDLDLGYVVTSWGAVHALANATFARLEVLRLQSARIDARAAGVLRAAPFAASLHTLELAKSTIGDAGVIALCDGGLPALRSLDLSDCKLGPSAATALAGSTALAGLERLVVAGNRLRGVARRALVERFGDRLVVERA